MADERISMPSGSGGLVRYYDEYKSKVKLKPSYVILLVVVVVVFRLALKIFGGS